jgi:hypothetical protein
MPTHSLYLTTKIPTSTPLAPTINSIVPNNSSAIITYTAGLDGGSAITSYTITYSSDDFVTSLSISNITTNPYTITSLTNNISYKLKLQAVNSNGIGISTTSQSFTPIPFTDYFPLMSNYTNLGTSGVSLSVVSASGNVSFETIASKSCAKFTSNGYLISSGFSSLSYPVSFCYWAYLPSDTFDGTITRDPFNIGDGSFTSIGDCLITEAYYKTNPNLAVYFALPTRDPFVAYAFNGSSDYTINNFSNKWFHYCYTLSSTSICIYVNGVKTTNSIGTFNNFKTLNPYKYIFGRSPEYNGNYLNGGGIRHFMSCNQILSQQNVTDIYNATA